MIHEFRQAQKDCLDVLVPIIVDWYEGLPSDKRYLLGGVVLGWELSPYVQAYFYENGNEYLDRPAAQDPVGGVWASIPLGYAAATALGLPSEGVISEETLDAICLDYLEFVTECAMQYRLPGDKIITHSMVGGAAIEFQPTGLTEPFIESYFTSSCAMRLGVAAHRR